jgi:dTDP-4-dehydrorhamnose 3,5-epimerase
VNITPTQLPGVLLVEPRVFSDERGSFHVAFNAAEYAGLGLEHRFVQDNVSVSRRGVLRGLHFQQPNAQGKLVHALRGEVFDVAVDIRVGSPTFGRATWTVLSEDNRRQIFVPPGFAHGFVVTSAEAVVAYKCSAYYSPPDEQTVRWSDPAFGIPWPIDDPILIARDANAPLLRDIPADRLPRSV